jgi:hypothetical protein
MQAFEVEWYHRLLFLFQVILEFLIGLLHSLQQDLGDRHALKRNTFQACILTV